MTTGSASKDRRHSCSRGAYASSKALQIGARSAAAPWVILILFFGLWPLRAADWQWSVRMGEGRAFLWIPPDCEYVRGVVVGQHNMSEEGILEHARFRGVLAELGFAAVWIAPPFDPVFAFDKGAGERLETLLRSLGDLSGYEELAFAPLVPIGHSACASYVWNVGAWNPGRTLAMLSIHGDAPLTSMTGSGRPNPDWGGRNIDGVPGLMVMAEYEWLEGRIEPLLAFRERFPGAPVAMLAEPGRGHFDVSDELLSFLGLFLRKAATARLPSDTPRDQAPVLRPVVPAEGWLVERWRLDRPRTHAPAPFERYGGDSRTATWCFDEEMARATHDYLAGQAGRLPTLLGFAQEGMVVPQRASHAQVEPAFRPHEDGVTFDLSAVFLESVDGGSSNTSRWTGLPPGAALGRPSGGGPILLSRITGPVEQVGPATFRVAFNRTASTCDRREHDIWLLASHPGDEVYKSAVQQALVRLPVQAEGRGQTLTFEPIDDLSAQEGPVSLKAFSDAGLPVGFYVREGPAEIEQGVLRLTAIPRRAALPIRVTVVAWQFGRGGADPVRAAAPVERSFLVTR